MTLGHEEEEEEEEELFTRSGRDPETVMF